MPLQPCVHTDATCLHTQYTCAGTPSHMHKQHACLRGTSLHAHAHTQHMHTDRCILTHKVRTCVHCAAGTGVHNTLPRTNEEEEGRHIILFPLIQMTSPPWHQLLF